MFERVIVQEDISLNNDSLKQNNQTESLIHNKNIIVQLLSDNLETKLNKSAAILEIVSTLPQMRALPNSSLIDPSVFTGYSKRCRCIKKASSNRYFICR